MTRGKILFVVPRPFRCLRTRASTYSWFWLRHSYLSYGWPSAPQSSSSLFPFMGCSPGALHRDGRNMLAFPLTSFFLSTATPLTVSHDIHRLRWGSYSSAASWRATERVDLDPTITWKCMSQRSRNSGNKIWCDDWSNRIRHIFTFDFGSTRFSDMWRLHIGELENEREIVEKAGIRSRFS